MKLYIASGHRTTKPLKPQNKSIADPFSFPPQVIFSLLPGALASVGYQAIFCYLEKQNY